MVIKRSVKVEMPKLKRCKLDEPHCEDEEHEGCSGSQKKHKVDGFNPEVDFDTGSASWNSEVTNNGGVGEVELNSSRKTVKVRFSCGGPQVLPSSFENDGKVMVKTGSNGSGSGLSFDGADEKINGNVGRRKDVYRLEEFTLGDIVWAKCGKRFPAWPGVVIDPLSEAPQSVIDCCVPDTLCVMFFGYSKNGTRVIIFMKVLLIYYCIVNLSFWCWTLNEF